MRSEWQEKKIVKHQCILNSLGSMIYWCLDNLHQSFCSGETRITSVVIGRGSSSMKSFEWSPDDITSDFPSQSTTAIEEPLCTVWGRLTATRANKPSGVKLNLFLISREPPCYRFTCKCLVNKPEILWIPTLSSKEAGWRDDAPCTPGTVPRSLLG